MNQHPIVEEFLQKNIVEDKKLDWYDYRSDEPLNENSFILFAENVNFDTSIGQYVVHQSWLDWLNANSISYSTYEIVIVYKFKFYPPAPMRLLVLQFESQLDIVAFKLGLL